LDGVFSVFAMQQLKMRAQAFKAARKRSLLIMSLSNLPGLERKKGKRFQTRRPSKKTRMRKILSPIEGESHGREKGKAQMGRKGKLKTIRNPQRAVWDRRVVSWKSGERASLRLRPNKRRE